MQAIVNVVIPVFGLILTGYLAGRFRVLGQASAEALNRFVFYFALPPLFFLSTAEVAIAEILRWNFLAAYFGATAATLVVALAGGRWLFGLRGTAPLTLHALSGIFANTAYLGIPLFITAFGAERILPAVVISVSTSMAVIGAGIFAIESGRGGGAYSRQRALADAALAVLRSPLFIAPAAGVAVSALGLALPRPVVNFAELLGATAGPGALFALGLTLVGRSLSVGLGEVSWLVAVKLAVHPFVTWLFVYHLIPVESFWAASAVLLAAMPTGALVFVLAQNYGTYVQRSSAAILLTTCLSVLTLGWLLARF